MTNKYIYFIANWKMFGKLKTLHSMNKVISFVKKFKKNKLKLIYCPPATLLSPLNNKLKSTTIQIGAQNCHESNSYGANTGQINSSMPLKISKQIEKLLKKNNLKKNNRILFLGLTYKKNIEDLRNSPSLEIFKYFDKKGYKINYNDNYVKRILINGVLHNSQKLNKLNKFKFIVLLTDHDYFKKMNIKLFKGIIFDTRFFYKNLKNINYL